MARRSRITIGDLLVLVAVSGLAFAGASLIMQTRARSDVGEAAFWLVTLGVATVLYLTFRFVRVHETRLILIGLAVAFAAAADGMYLALYLNLDVETLLVVGGLMAVAIILVAGGVTHGLLSRWYELRYPRATEPDRTIDP